MRKEGRRIDGDQASKTSAARANGRSAFVTAMVADAASWTLFARVPTGSCPSTRFCRAVPDSGAGRRADAAADSTIWHGCCDPLLGHSDGALRAWSETSLP